MNKKKGHLILFIDGKEDKEATSLLRDLKTNVAARLPKQSIYFFHFYINLL